VDADKFFSALESCPPVVAMGGDERVYVDDALVLLRARVLAGGLADFNHDRVSARDRPLQDALHLARTLPVMSPKRLVEVRDASSLSDDDVTVLEAYLDRPSPEAVLVLVFDAIDLRKRLPKVLEKRALFMRFDHPRDREMPEHVVRRAKRHKLFLDGDAVEALAITVGTDLGLLDRALEKLALVAENGRVDVNLVSTHVADTHLEDAFGLSRAVARGDRKEALLTLAKLEAGLEAEPIQLIGMLAWQLRLLVRARALLDNNERPDNIGRDLKLFGDRLSSTLSAARNFTLVEHQKRLVRLAGADRLLKGSRQPRWLVLGALIQALCPLPAASARSGQSPRR
jgi:DNA polymerase-3 subunit delta